MNDFTGRSQGRRKSRFPALTTIPSDATFDFVSNGTNYKITAADFFAALGVTGSIEQGGAETGTPVLDIQGSVNKIRNIENGSGVKAQVSPENGVTLSHNFLFDNTGAALSQDPSLPQPVLRSLTAGSGINVSASGGTIQISSTDVPASNKTVIVSTKSDFPAAVGGVITLADDTVYYIRNDINMGTDRFTLGDNTVIQGESRNVITITYTGTDFLFTTTVNPSAIKRLTIQATTGKMIDCEVGSGNIFVMEDIIYNVDEFGLFNGTGGFCRLSNVSGTVLTNGSTFSGTWAGCIFETTAATINGGVFYDLGTAVFDALYIQTHTVSLGAGTTFLSGLTNSGNLSVGSLASVTDGRFTSAGSVLSGVSTTDARWQFLLNDGIADTRTDGLLSLQGNATATTISVTGTPVKVAGTWAVELESQMTGDTTGRLTLDTEKDNRLPIGFSLTVEPVSGGTQQVAAYVAINGVAVTNSKRQGSASSGNPTSITGLWQADLSPTDYVEVWVANDSGTTNLLVSAGISRVN